MSDLFEKKRLSAFGEAFYAYRYAFACQKTMLPNQFWPIIVMIISFMILAFGAHLLPRSAMMQTPPAVMQQHMAPDSDVLVPEEGMATNLDMPAPITSSSYDTQNGNVPLVHASKIPGVGDFTPRFDFKVMKPFLIVFGGFYFFLLISVLMSNVKMFRYMILGEGQSKPAIPRFSLGMRELKLLGWALLVKTIIPLLIVLPIAFLVAFVLKVPETNPDMANLVFGLMGLSIFLVIMRLVFVFPAVCCDHGPSLCKAWKQMKGIFTSFILANIFSILPALLFMMFFFAVPVVGLVVLMKGVGMHLMQSQVTGIAFMLLMSVYGVWAFLTFMAAQVALISRYYHFGSGLPERSK